MRCARGVAILQCLMVAGLLLAGCPGGGGPDQAELAKQTEWEAIQEAKEQLDASRRELAEAREAASLTAEEAPAAGEGEEGSEPAEEGGADIAKLEEALVERADTFNKRLVDFLNADPMIEGEPPTERQLAALRLKSDEDMILAGEWIEKGGDYKRAIEIYTTALMFDPDNEKLKEALAKAEEERYMSAERFALAKNGMSEDEVRAVLGQVNRYNKKDYPDRKVTAWFYPTSEEGTAAGVWFRADKSGALKVYQLQYEAVKLDDPDKSG